VGRSQSRKKVSVPWHPTVYTHLVEKILVGLSGGVDSAVAAALLVKQGHEVVGGYMKNWINEDHIPGECPWEQDLADAQAVADVLGIELRVVDLTQEYKNRIVLYLLNGYEDGLTPNPDVMCNREMKFGVFRTYAKANGFDAVATGHYARRLMHEDGSVELIEGLDKNKDQSYFLSLMQQEQLLDARFPVGEFPKPEVRQIAEKFGLPVATKKDSQGICFIGQIKMSDFLRTYVPDKPGKIVDLEGKIMGEHRGLHLYTLGQRRGHGVASPYHGEAYVVVEKRSESNELVVAIDRPETPGLYAQGCRIGSLSWTNIPVTKACNLEAKPRYRCERQMVRLTPEPDGRASLTFMESQRALAPGQICALYDGETCLGGGIFETIFYDTKPVSPESLPSYGEVTGG